MTRTPVRVSVIVLAGALLGVGCGAGETEGNGELILEQTPVSYTERSAHNTAPPTTDTERPLDDTEQAVGYDDSSGATATVQGNGNGNSQRQPAACQLAVDACDGCTTYAACCDCFGEPDYCDLLCGTLP